MRSAQKGNRHHINCSLRLPSDSFAPSAARAFVRRSVGSLAPHGDLLPSELDLDFLDLDDFDLDDLDLLVSEVVTNAVIHGEGASVEVTVSNDSGCTRVGVTDHSRTPPFVVEPDPARPSGRGIFLVDQLASRWGIDSIPGNGKCVWFECSPAGHRRAAS